MTTALKVFSQKGFFVFSFPESAVPADVRDDFISTVKAEWLARQSQMTEEQARSLSDKIDSGWWAKNKSRILSSIGEE